LSWEDLRKHFFFEKKKRKKFPCAARRLFWIPSSAAGIPTLVGLRRLKLSVRSTREKFFASFFKKEGLFLP
jgi:hypothetical protein